MLPSICPRKPPSSARREGRRVARRGVAQSVASLSPSDLGSWHVIREVAGDTQDDMADRLQVQGWLDSFNHEKQQYASVTTCAELFYSRVLSATESLPEPNVLRTAACMMLIEQITSLFGRYRPLMTSLYSQLYAAVFLKGDGGEYQMPAECTDPSLEKVLSQKYVRRTYFAAHEDLVKAHEKLTAQTAMVQRSLLTLWKVLERAIGLWQGAYIKTIFAAWRGRVKQRKAHLKQAAAAFRESARVTRIRRALRNLNENVTFRQKRMQDDGISAAGTIVGQLRREKEELLDQLQAMQHIVEAKDIRIGIISSENRSLREEKKKILEKYVHAQRHASRLSGMVSRWCADMMSPRFDWLARRRADDTLFRPGNGVEYLVSWAESLIQRYIGNEGKCQNFMHNVRTGRPYLFLLRALAPGHCSEGWLIRCLSEGDDFRRCDAAVTRAKRLGVLCSVEPEDLLSASFEVNYMFLAQLFRRFATPQASLGPDGAARMWSDSPDAEDEPNVSPDKVSPDDWQKRWDIAKGHNDKWSRKLDKVMKELEAELADSLRRGVRKSVNSQAVESQLAPFYDLPVDSYADLLTSLSGDTSSVGDVHISVTKMLRQQVGTLRKVYKFYCTRDTQLDAPGAVVQTMSLAEYANLCADMAIPEEYIPEPSSVCARLRPTDLSLSVGEVSAEEDRLGPREFSLALLLMACKMFEGDISERVRRFVVEVLQHAKASSADSFKHDVSDSDVQNVMQAYRQPLTQLFVRYGTESEAVAGGDKKKGGRQGPRGARMCMHLGAWSGFVADFTLADVAFDSAAVVTTFHSVQDDSSEGSAVTLEYAEFVESLVAVAMFKYPSPFEPLSLRVSRFFKQQLRLSL